MPHNGWVMRPMRLRRMKSSLWVIRPCDGRMVRPTRVARLSMKLGWSLRLTRPPLLCARVLRPRHNQPHLHLLFFRR